MRTTAIALILILLGSVSVSSADQYEITFTNITWEPTYDNWETVFPGVPLPQPQPLPPRILNGILTWDSAQQRLIQPGWTWTGGSMRSPFSTGDVNWETATDFTKQQPLIIFSEGDPLIFPTPGASGGGLFQFVTLTVPGTYPNPDVGPVPVGINGLFITGSVIGGPLWSGSAVSGSETVTLVAVPELAILRTFSRHIYGRQLAAFVNPSLQRATAWGAATMLRAVQIPAVQRGVHVDLPSVSMEVEEWCSGLVSMKWLSLLALFIALVGSGSVPWKIALVVIAPLIAVEANVLRVVGIGVGLEVGGYDHRNLLKDGVGWIALMLGVVQIIGLGRLMNRQRIIMRRS